MKVYLSGPMTGYEDLNKPEFHRCAKELRDAGYEVVSPAEIEDGEDWDACLKADLREMLTCDAIVQMDGWEASRGERMETAVGILIGMPCYSFQVALDADASFIDGEAAFSE